MAQWVSVPMGHDSYGILSFSFLFRSVSTSTICLAHCCDGELPSRTFGLVESLAFFGSSFVVRVSVPMGQDSCGI